MSWDHFIYFSIVALLLWATGAWAAWRDRRTVAYVTTVVGLVVFFAFILGMWISLERPPLRTMGETRLWYSFFLPVAGLMVYSRWKYKWVLSFSTFMALIFICVNLFKPEIHSKTLMPALQSPWFAPHVIVYMFCYAIFGVAPLMAVCMLFGALWAKEAWGHYWAWDPKETWAAITWFAYLLYIHYRLYRPREQKPVLWMLIVAFLLLQMCWWGINYLPSAQATSVHTYTN